MSLMGNIVKVCRFQECQEHTDYQCLYPYIYIKFMEKLCVAERINRRLSQLNNLEVELIIGHVIGDSVKNHAARKLSKLSNPFLVIPILCIIL